MILMGYLGPLALHCQYTEFPRMDGAYGWPSTLRTHAAMPPLPMSTPITRVAYGGRSRSSSCVTLAYLPSQ
jgi:hypothetical protein